MPNAASRALAAGLLAACLALAAGAASQPSDQPSAAPQTLSPTENPREALVVLKNGREIRGLFVAYTETEVVIRVAAIDTRFPRDDVASVRMLEPILDRYHRLRAAIADDDIEARLHLVQWLRDREQYQVALSETQDILQSEPGNPKARELALWLEQQTRLLAQDQSEAEQIEARSLPDRRRRVEFPTLTPDEINLIKVYEVDLADPPRMTISREAVERFAKAYASDPRVPSTAEGIKALQRMPPARILELMFSLQAREFYGEIKVLQTPPSMQRFRDKVHATWLANACATADCHGGGEAGRLWLRSIKPHTDESVYTNFLIIDRFRLPDGTPLINYEDPAQSPLLHMALPRERSAYPHPQTSARAGLRGWRPLFKDTDERRFREATEWIRSMYRPRPDYPIAYEPPTPQLLRDRPIDVER